MLSEALNLPFFTEANFAAPCCQICTKRYKRMIKIIQVLTFPEDGKTFTLHDGYLALTALQQ